MSEPKRPRLKKYTREKPENLPPRRITPRSIAIIDIIHRYKFVPTSMIVRLVEGDMRTTERHLQNLYHQGFINRFAFPSTYYPTEFNYYLDDKNALDLLIDNGHAADTLDYESVSNNREKQYSAITMGKEMVKMPGRLMHLHHELMISRFRYMLEKACNKSGDKVKMLGFYQGSQLWNTVEVRRVLYDHNGALYEVDETEKLPHRPDAFFGLHFPDRDGEDRSTYYFYEADRQRTSIKKMQKKLRSHFHYIVKQKRHTGDYGVKRIKAVLVESIEDHWADSLRVSAKHSIVSGSKPSPLFWFTPSDLMFEKLISVKVKGVEKQIPIFLENPERVFGKIWATPADNNEQPVFQSLID